MKTANLLLSLALLSASPAIPAFELATEITRTGETTTLASVGYAKLGLIRIPADASGRVHLDGRVSVAGTANILLWAKVEGNYYFSKLPALQNLSNARELAFEIPFDAADKTISEIVLEVELLGAGKVEIANPILVKNRGEPGVPMP